jgi:hypothetical protein
VLGLTLLALVLLTLVLVLLNPLSVLAGGDRLHSDAAGGATIIKNGIKIMIIIHSQCSQSESAVFVICFWRRDTIRPQHGH